MANAATNGATAPDAAASITIRISPVIEREFKRRDIFPDLRLENASRIQNGATGIHKVSVERVKHLLADAEAMQAHSRELPRGIPAAYSALMRNLKCTLKEEARRGLWEDPGMDEMKKRAAQSPARFEVGDKALCFKDDDEYGAEVTVFEAYAMYSVLSDAGAYISAQDGKRVNYQFGYVVKHKGSEHSFFVMASQLTRDDCKPAHLCLVASRPAATFC